MAPEHNVRLQKSALDVRYHSLITSSPPPACFPFVRQEINMEIRAGGDDHVTLYNPGLQIEMTKSCSATVTICRLLKVHSWAPSAGNQMHEM